jgi:hypothetical protein
VVANKEGGGPKLKDQLMEKKDKLIALYTCTHRSSELGLDNGDKVTELN